MYNSLNARIGRFVLLKHELPVGCERPNHWDLMIQWDAELITFELLALPQGDADMPVVRLPNHRSLYLDFEGAISGNRGTVVQEAAGQFESQGFPDRIDVKLTGDRLDAFVEIPMDNGTWCPVECQTKMRIREWNFRPAD